MKENVGRGVESIGGNEVDFAKKWNGEEVVEEVGGGTWCGYGEREEVLAVM